MADMITSFTLPYEDETFPSIVARVLEQGRFPFISRGLRSILGTSTPSSRIDFPDSLEFFVNQLPPGHEYSVEFFIETHSLLPYRRPFLSAERLARIQVAMRNQFSHPHGGRSKLSSKLRFCPLCAKEEERRLGESYWHRSHQVIGHEICLKHLVYLHTSSVPSTSKYAWNLVSAQSFIDTNVSGKITSPTRAELKVLKPLAESIEWLLKLPDLINISGSFHARFRIALKEQGLANVVQTSELKVNLMELKERISSYYGSDLLARLVGGNTTKVQLAWIIGPLQSVSETPLGYLLLINTLGYTVPDFLGLPAEFAYLPFGSGRWPCLNSVGNHKNKLVINDYEKQQVKRHKLTVVKGIFTCPLCGFVYSRFEPDSNSEGKFTYDEVIKYGSYWEKEFLKWWSDPTTTQRDIVKHFQLSGISKVQALARERHFPAKVTLPVATRHLLDELSIEYSPDKKDLYRAIALKLIDKYPDKKRSELRKLHKGVGWLYQNDVNWVDQHFPPKDTSSGIEASHRTKNSRRVQRDTALARRVLDVAQRIKERDGIPQRIYTNTILSDLGALHLWRNLENYPETQKAIAGVIESSLEYAIRKMQRVANQCIETGVKPPRWKLRRLSSTESYHKNLEFNKALDEAMSLFN
jgi:hypothetical protein